MGHFETLFLVFSIFSFSPIQISVYEIDEVLRVTRDFSSFVLPFEAEFYFNVESIRFIDQMLSGMLNRTDFPEVKE